MRLFPFSHFIIRGESMLPTFKPGEHVLSINWWIFMSVGDVVIVTVNGRPLIKRITQIKKDKVFLEGDNQEESTDSRTLGWIAKSDIIGIILCKF